MGLFTYLFLGVTASLRCMDNCSRQHQTKNETVKLETDKYAAIH